MVQQPSTSNSNNRQRSPPFRSWLLALIFLAGVLIWPTVYLHSQIIPEANNDYSWLPSLDQLRKRAAELEIELVEEVEEVEEKVKQVEKKAVEVEEAVVEEVKKIERAIMNPLYPKLVFQLDDGSPPLFMTRLNRLLPLNESDRYLSLEEIIAIEKELMQFNIPRPVTVQARDAEYISIQAYRWLFMDQKRPAQDQQCPNCNLHFGTWARDGATGTHPDNLKMFRENRLKEGEVADALLHMGCPKEKPKNFPQHEAQVLIGGCGESQIGTGRVYANIGRKFFDYNGGFHDMEDGSPFPATYAHLHLSPSDNFLGYPTLWSVSDFARQLLRPPPKVREQPQVATFIHNVCTGPRGGLLKAIDGRHQVDVARYGACLHNAELPASIRPYDEKPCGKRAPEFFFHHDCEATRDGSKTVLAGFHKFTFSLENTWSKDYFTEKRWEALLAGSVPIVWDNHNSLDSLPDRDSALIVPAVNDPNKLSKEVSDRLQYYDKNETAYQELFRWKERGLRVGFVRKLFLSHDYLICRICEHVAHHHQVN